MAARAEPTGRHGSKVDVLKRTGRGFLADGLNDWAAALTYYGILAIFPALLALVSLLGLIGGATIDTLLDNVEDLAPGSARDVLAGAIENLRNGQGTAGLLFVFGFGAALWAASGYVGAFMRASNAIYDIPEGRPLHKKLPIRLGITVVLLILLAITALAVAVTGPLAREVGNLIGLGDTAVQVWDIAKWPVLLAVVSFMFAFLYWAAPNARQPGFRWVSAGGILAVVLWIAASLGFAFYVSNFANYNETYGSLGGVIVFLIWLWITNIAILLGAELNSELERSRRVESGEVGPDDEPFVDPRDTRKIDDRSR